METLEKKITPEENTAETENKEVYSEHEDMTNDKDCEICKASEGEVSANDADEIYEDVTEEQSTEEPQEDLFASLTIGDILSLEKELGDENIFSEIKSDGFKLFSKGKKGTASEICKAYKELKKELLKGMETDTPNSAAQANSQAFTKVPRDFSSFSGDVSSRDYSLSLSKRQMDIARESGMSYSENEEMHASIPGKRL